MNLWLVLAALLGAASAAPCLRCSGGRGRGGGGGGRLRRGRPADFVLVGPPVYPPAVTKKPLPGTKTKTDVGGNVISTGNAKAVVSGGAKAAEKLGDQKSGADSRLTLNTQKEGIGSGSAASIGRSDRDKLGRHKHASSQGDSRTEVRSVGQASTEADANARGSTVGKGAKTDASGGSSSATSGDGTAAGASQTVGTSGQHSGSGTDAGSGTASQAESSGSGGSKVAGRGRGAALGGNTTSLSGSQTKVDVIGDAKAQSVQRGGASGELAENGVVRQGRTKAGSEGDAQTVGEGASAAGESTAKGTAGLNGTTSSDSAARNKLKTSRTGSAKANVISTGLTALGFDDFTKDLVVDTKSKTTGSQQTAGSGSSSANGATTAGSSLVGGAAVADSAFKGTTSGAGQIKGMLEARGQGRVTKGEPVVQPHKPQDSGHKPGLKQNVPPYVPPNKARPQYVDGRYVQPTRDQRPYVPPYLPQPPPRKQPYRPPYKQSF